MLQAATEPLVTKTIDQVRVYNETTHPVTTLVTAVVPLAHGSYFGGSAWRAVSATSNFEYVHHEQMGMSWPDGSWRTAVVHFNADVPVGIDGKLVTIQEAQTTPPNFTLHDDVLATLQVGWPVFRLGIGAESLDLFDQPGQIIEATALTRVLRFRGRVPNTPFWGELLVQLHHLQRHGRFWFWYGNSWIDDPLRTSVEYTLPGDVALGVLGARCHLRHESVKQWTKVVDGANTVIGLIQRTEAQGFFPDGCSQGLTGVLLFGADPLPTDTSADAETWRGIAAADVLAVSTNWPTSRAFGPFGHVVGRPAWVPDDETYRFRAVTRANSDYASSNHASLGPWSFQQYGCNPSPGNSGSQADFGVTRHTGVASSGHPAGLKAAQRSAYQEFNRPNVFRFQDVSLWSQAARPTFFLDGRPHYTDPDSDPLGKERRAPAGLPYPRNKSSDQWRPIDFEHYSMNDLTFYALLSGDRLARALCEYRCDVWMAENTYPGSLGSSGSTRNGPHGPSRSRGRQNQAGAQLLLVSGRSDFETWIRARFAAADLAIWESNGKPYEWAGFAKRNREDQLRSIQVEHWKVWEELQAVQGYGAIYSLLGVTQARTDALRVAKSMFTNGVEPRTETSSWQRYRFWPGAAWSAPGNPPFGTQVTVGGGTGKILYYAMPTNGSDYDGHIVLYDCAGTFTNGSPIVADTGAQIGFVFGSGYRYREDRTEVAFQQAFNSGEFLTDAQKREFEPLAPPNSKQPLRNVRWGGITLAWSFGALLLLRKWAQDTGDGAAEATAQAILDNWLPARGAPDGGFLDEGDGAWSQWAGVVEDPF